MTMDEVSPPVIDASSVERRTAASAAALPTLSRYDCRMQIASQ